MHLVEREHVVTPETTVERWPDLCCCGLPGTDKIHRYKQTLEREAGKVARRVAATQQLG